MLFILLFCQNKSSKITTEEEINKYENKFKNIYENLFIIINNIYFSKTNNDLNSNSILEIADIFEFLRLNLLIGLNDFVNKSYIFNISIHSLIKFSFCNEDIKNINGYLIMIFNQIYKALSSSKNNLNFLRRNKNYENFTILTLTDYITDSQNDKDLINSIMKILCLIYMNNYSSLIHDYILDKIKECFYEIKENNTKNILKSIKNIYGAVKFLDILFMKEEYERYDPYMPSSFFVFSDNEYSGINYNPNNELLKKNFTLIFSFKINEFKQSEIYPLITYVNFFGENEILFNISVTNKKLQIYFQGDSNLKDIHNISTNESYLIIIEYKSSNISKNKITIYINGKSYFYPAVINHKVKCSLKIGYLPNNESLARNKIFKNAKKFVGIMGPIIQFSCVFEEKNFIPNLFSLKGNYDLILLINKITNFDYVLNYEEYQYYQEKDIYKIKYYFLDFAKKINEDFLFSICPKSIINNHDTYFFCQNIYNKSKKNNQELFPNFTTLSIPSCKSFATYAKKNKRSIAAFVEYDGISIYTLIIEYFYNILRMLINNPKEEKIELSNEMYKIISLIIKNFFGILRFFKLNELSDTIDTFGFSIKKLFYLLIDIQPLNDQIIFEIVRSGNELIIYSKKLDQAQTKIIIMNFIGKFISLIFSSKNILISNFSIYEKFFDFINNVLKKNNDLVNDNFMKELLTFSYILDPVSFDEYKNNPGGTTIPNNKEYKKMRKQYKNLLSNFIQRANSYEIYLNYLQNIFSNQNFSWTEKYNLIKIYYKFHVVESLYNNEKENKKVNKPSLNIFKNEKNNKKNFVSEKDLYNEYQNIFNTLINTIPPKNKKSEISFELNKSIFCLLLYEHKSIIYLNSFNEKKESLSSKDNLKFPIKIEEKQKENYYFFSSPLMDKTRSKVKNKNIIYNSSGSFNIGSNLFKIEEIEINKENNENNDKLSLDNFSEGNYKNDIDISFEIIEKEISIDNNENYLFDTYLNSKNYSIYTIKAIFSCLCDKWDKQSKIKFIKMEKEQFFSFKDYIIKFDRYKKELFYQFLCLIECVKEENLLQKCIKLIFAFINDIISRYTEDLSNKSKKSLFLHTIESKSIMNKFFSYCLNNKIVTNKEFRNFIVIYMEYINNNSLLYHPKPYLFSLINNLIKAETSEIVSLLDKCFKSIIRELNSGKEDFHYFYKNCIYFLKTLLNALKKYPEKFQDLFIKNNFELFHSIQHFFSDMVLNYIVYDPNLYIFNNDIICINKNDKNSNKFFQSSTTKLLSNQINFLNLFEISFNSIYLLWKIQDKDKNIVNICLDYIIKFHQEILIKENCIGFYLDISNPYFSISNKSNLPKIPEDKIKLIKNDIINKELWKNNYCKREKKIISFSWFLIIIKYKSLLINFEKLKRGNNYVNSIENAFEPYNSISEKEIKFLIANINKIKENKNLEIMIEREESKSKEYRDYNKNYYKYFYEKIKNKNNDLKNVIEEIKNKFIVDEIDKNKINKNHKNIYSNDLKTVKKEKIRKDSYGDYGIDNESEEGKIKEIKTSKEVTINKKIFNIDNKEKTSLDFENAKYPLLCTKKDLILKTFGYFYYKYYFKNDKFIKLRQLYFYQNNPSDIKNNYYGFEKIMKNEYPFIIKNFSNYNLYYPRVFYKPYHKFFKDEFLNISHPYYKKEKYEKIYQEKKMHLEYGHGLLNQSNFDLYVLSDKNDIINDSISTSLSKGSLDENIFGFESNYEDDIEQNTTSISFPDDILVQNNSQHFRTNSMNKLSLNYTKVTTYSPKTSNNQIDLDISSNKSKTNNVIKFECERIAPKNSSNGFLAFSNCFLIYQVNTKFDKKLYKSSNIYLISSPNNDLEQEEKQIIIPYNLISQIIIRKFLFYEVAIEIFLYNGKSYFFNFYSINNKIKFMKIMVGKIKKEIIITKQLEYFEKKKYLSKWLEGSLSTLDYLLLINKFSDRSYNVLSQYLILPWIFSKFDNIYDSKSLRTFDYPGIALTKDKLDEAVSNEDLSSLYPNFFSNNMYVNHYLFRSYPYINNQIKIQENRFDSPARQFNSVSATLYIFEENFTINMELVPEFYFIPELFLNLNYCYYGRAFEKKMNYLINNLGIGPDFHYILEIINYHQINIDSENIITRINKWIDYAFGECQLYYKKNSMMNFPRECYGKFVKEDINEQNNIIKSMKKVKRKGDRRRQSSAKSDQVDLNKLKGAKEKIKELFNISQLYGHCPTQIFTKPHPSFNKKIESKICNFTQMNKLQIILKNERFNVDSKDILYMQESSKGNYFYIVYLNEIMVFNKNLKMVDNLSINNISPFPHCFSIKYSKKNNPDIKSFDNYKYLIFDIMDCKYFFIGGYIDNSLKIYFKDKDKEKDEMYFIYVNSQIKCIRNCLFNKIFFTGHENGKIIKWKYQINSENNQISIFKENSVRGHRSSIKMIELNEKFECIISVDIDEIILIRKIYDFELLSYIKLDKYCKKVIDINIYNQIVILTILKIKLNEIYIYTYSLNGLKLGKILVQLNLPINIIPKTDEMIVFNYDNIYITKVAFNEKASLITVSNDLEVSNVDLTSEKDNDVSYNFNEDLRKNKAISYFYDNKNKILFCLFSNGILYRINFVKSA